jgi:AcrR family transcriptional regulator
VAGTSNAPRRGYHHGGLRAALVAAAGKIVSEVGVANFSVAEAARRAGVSSGAPYRHFADRDALLAAVALQIAEELAEVWRAAVATSDDAAEQLVAVTLAYMHFAVAAGSGYDLIFGSVLDNRQHPELLQAGRALNDLLIPIGLELTAEAQGAIDMLEAQIALMHGYARLLRDGFFRAPIEDVGERAATAVRALIDGYR